MNKKGKGALFIDGDNVSHKIVGQIIAEFAELADVRLCTVYGNTNSGNFVKICQKASEYGFKTCVLNRGKPKNGVDVKIAIDVTNMINRNSNITIYGLASNDYDFSVIAEELVSRGYDVFGFGEDGASVDFRNKCTRFDRLEKAA